MEYLTADKLWIFGRLKHSLRVLADSAETQLRVVPAFGYRADELFLSFDHWRLKLLANFQFDLTAEQLSCLNSLQRIFAEMRHECWTDSGVAGSTEWSEVRSKSSETLLAFGWR
jgi:hypothetical protein